MSGDDIVGVLRNGNHPSCVDSWTNGSGVPCDLCAERLNAADELQQLRDEIERLRAAGDKVAHTLSVQSEWTCCADGWFGPCGCPPDVATRPTDDSVATALAAWQEARRG